MVYRYGWERGSYDAVEPFCIKLVVLPRFKPHLWESFVGALGIPRSMRVVFCVG